MIRIILIAVFSLSNFALGQIYYKISDELTFVYMVNGRVVDIHVYEKVVQEGNEIIKGKKVQETSIGLPDFDQALDKTSLVSIDTLRSLGKTYDKLKGKKIKVKKKDGTGTVYEYDLKGMTEKEFKKIFKDFVKNKYVFEEKK